MLLPLQKGILYGPVASRRLGRSLGINLMPVHYKLCSFNCVYCHYGLTEVLCLAIKDHVQDLPLAGEVLDRVEETMKSSLSFDYITFSGNGEPTLHPQFCEIAKGVVHLRNKYRAPLKIALLSNSSGLVKEQARQVISQIDVPVFKLDAGNADLFQQINKPANNINFEEIIEFLRQMEGIYLQTVLMRGKPSNTEEEELKSYFDKIAYIKPKEIQIYSLDRPFPNRNIKQVLPEELEVIARKGSRETGVSIQPYCV